jgi:ABC-type lipoprotein export system ATPase subunit
MSESIIRVDDLRRTYKVGTQEIPALRGVSLQVEAGHFIALKGRSGSGKTTLLNCLGGLDRPDSGSVQVLGHDLMSLDEAALTRWRRDNIGLIFQSFGLLPTLSAYENVELMPRIKGVGAKDRDQYTLTALALVGLAERADHRPYELSGGQQQRVAIARALANRPKLIFADEPTGELDSTTGHEILALFRRLVETEGVTLLMVTHDPKVDEYAHRVLNLKDGQIVEA